MKNVHQRKRAKIVLQTSLGLKVFKGKPKGPVGVLKFSGLLEPIWEAAGQDDPYADLWLLRIYEALRKARSQLLSIETEHRKLLKQDGLEMDIFFNTEAIRISLVFKIPYAFMAAYVLADFDRVVRLCVSLNHFGLLPEKELSTVLRQAARIARQGLSSPLQWQSTGVTRKDITKNNSKAKRAKELLGEINDKVLSKEIAPPFAPKPSMSFATTTQNEGSKATEPLKQARS